MYYRLPGEGRHATPLAQMAVPFEQTFPFSFLERMRYGLLSPAPQPQPLALARGRAPRQVAYELGVDGPLDDVGESVGADWVRRIFTQASRGPLGRRTRGSLRSSPSTCAAGPASRPFPFFTGTRPCYDRRVSRGRGRGKLGDLTLLARRRKQRGHVH